MEVETAEQKKERLNIEESREKRLGRVKAKQRDRGGIFKPSETNPLIDILMSRDVSGRSPSKARTKPRRPSAAKVSRSNLPTHGKSVEARAMDRRKSVAANASVSVAGKGRRKNVAPSKKTNNETIAVHSGNDINVHGKTKSSDVSRSSSKRSEDPKFREKKAVAPTRQPVITALPSSCAPAPSPKRHREDAETTADKHYDDADLPSPPKRAKKSAISATSTPASVSKSAKTARKAPAKPKTEAKTKGKVRDPSVDQDDEDADEVPSSKPKRAPAPKKRGRPKKVADTVVRLDNEDGSYADEGPSTSKAKPKRTPAAKTKSKPKVATKRVAAGRAKKNQAADDEEEDNGTIAGKGRGKAKGKGKKKAEPDIEPDTEPESEEETHYHTNIFKPHLDTVVEEDEEAEEENNGEDRIDPSKNSSGTHKNAPTSKPEEPKRDEKRKRKRKPEDEVDDASAPRAIRAAVTKKAKTGSRPKASLNVDEERDAKEEKPLPKARRKPKDPATTSRSKANPVRTPLSPSPSPEARGAEKVNGHPLESDDADLTSKPTVAKKASTSKTTVPSTSKSTAATKAKSTTRTKWPAPARKSKFANLPTTLFDSPIKVADNEDDEIDFLS